MPKSNRNGQAEIFSDDDYARVFRHISNPIHRLFLSVARYTGERVGALLQLEVGDVYADASRAVPLTTITFRARTRKASPSGKRKTRQVPVHSLLDSVLRSYQPPDSGWLFPSPRIEGRHATYQHYCDWFHEAIAKAGLSHRGFSWHSPRRTLITNLHRRGVSLATIQSITGHKSLNVMRSYIEDDPTQIRAALDLL